MPNPDQSFNDKERFVREHATEIKPVAPDVGVIGRVEHGETVNETELDSALEAFENKLFTMEKRECAPDAQSVLLTMDNPGSWRAMSPVIEALERDQRCRSVSVITGGFSSEEFKSRFGNQFSEVRDGDNLFLNDLNTVTSKHPIDVMLASGSAQNGPESVPLYSGKSVFGAKKVFYIVDSWGLGGSLSDDLESAEKRKKWLDDLDGFFCNDEHAKEIIREKLPGFPESRIHVTGTPILESLEIDKAKSYRNAGRARFNLPLDTLTVLYIGDQSADYATVGIGADPEINEKTFEKMLNAYIRYAESEPQKQFALLVRPHPRDSAGKLPELMSRATLPSNLVMYNAAYPAVKLNEAAFTADAVASIASTENFLAPLRGKRPIYLGFADEQGLGQKVIEFHIGVVGIHALKRQPETALVSTEAELMAVLRDFSRREPFAPKAELASGSAKRILDIMFGTQA